MERRPYRPGQHGRARIKVSDHKVRLLEKQRLRAHYDLGEAHLRLALARAAGCPARPARAAWPRWRPGWTRWSCARALPARSTRPARRSATGISRSTVARSTSPPAVCPGQVVAAAAGEHATPLRRGHPDTHPPIDPPAL